MSDFSNGFGQGIPTMQAPPLPVDEAKILDNLDLRVSKLEQLVTGSMQGRLTYVEDGNFPDGVIIDGDPIDLTPPEDVENVTATPGSFFENIFVDVEWDESASGPDAVSFDVDIAERTTGPVYTILNVFNTGGTNIRINNLKPNFDYGVRVVPVNALGVRAAPPAWVDFTTGADATVPPAPGGVSVHRGATTVIVKFTGLTEAEAPDVAWGHGTYEVEIDTLNTFNGANYQKQITTATIVAFNDIILELPNWYARVRAIDSSGNASAWSATAGPLAEAGGVVDQMVVADLSAAKIQFGTMSGDRIAVNTLDAGRIKTSSLTSADITLAGGSFRAGSPPTDGLLINSQGLRLYNGGVATVILDAATGNATFNGSITSGSTIAGSAISGGTITGTSIIGSSIKTAISGERIELGSLYYGSTTLAFYGPSDSAPTAEIGAGGGIMFLAAGTTTFWIIDDGVSPALLYVDTAEISMEGTNEIGLFSDGTVRVGAESEGDEPYCQIAGGIVALGALGTSFSIGDPSGKAELHCTFFEINSSLTTVNGDFNVTGTKAFAIDHPLYDDKTLVHAAVEGPESGVYYRGKSQMNNGKSTVVLPDYFEALTRREDRTVLLTPVWDGQEPPVLAASDVKNGKFTVRASRDVEFYWEVKAARSDIPRLDVTVDRRITTKARGPVFSEVKKRDLQDERISRARAQGIRISDRATKRRRAA